MFLFLIALTLPTAALLIALILLSLQRRNTSTDAACGHCGYKVQGLPTDICPECGSDLRKVGIRMGNPTGSLTLLMTAIASTWKRMLILTLVPMAVTGAIVYAISAFFISYQMWPSATVKLQATYSNYEILIEAGTDPLIVSGWFNHKPESTVANRLSLVIAPAGKVYDFNFNLLIHLKTWSSEFFHWLGGTSPTPALERFDRTQLERLYRESKVDMSSPEVQNELDSLMQLFSRCRTEPLLQLATSVKHFKLLSARGKSTLNRPPSSSGPLGPTILLIFFGVWWPMIISVLLHRIWLLQERAGTHFKIGGQQTTDSARSSQRVTKTVTVLFSDIKDYTARSTATSRNGAIELVQCHRDLAIPVIRSRHGNIVKTIGDAILATFESATDAALAGLEIQAAVTRHNSACGLTEQIHLRIAVASGEVIVEAGDIYGDTVNLASRLQGVAQPGQVILSASTHSLINQREVKVEPAGTFQLAGFSSPISAFIAIKFDLENDRPAQSEK